MSPFSGGGGVYRDFRLRFRCPFACSVTNEPFGLIPDPKVAQNEVELFYVKWNNNNNNKPDYNTILAVAGLHSAICFSRVTGTFVFFRPPSQSEFLSIYVGLQAKLGEKTMSGVWGAHPDVVSSNNQLAEMKFPAQCSSTKSSYTPSCLALMKWSWRLLVASLEFVLCGG